MQNGSTMLRRLGLSCKIKLIESDQIRQPTLVEDEGRYPIDTGTALKIGEHERALRPHSRVVCLHDPKICANQRG
jgi:hypothetical protein